MGYVSEDRDFPESRAFANKQNASLSAGDRRVKNNVCRYYQAGHCRRGTVCHFAHPPKSEEAPANESPPSHPDEGDGQRFDLMGSRADHFLPPACFPYNQTPVYHPAHSQTLSPFLWQPYPLPLPRFGHPHPPDIYSDYPDDTSDPSSSEASSTMTHFDYDVRWTHAHTYSSSFIRGSVPPHCGHGVARSSEYTDFSGTINHEGFAPRGATASLGYHSVDRFAIVYPRALFLPWQDDPKRKPLAYKSE
ncbi:hypothetical protein F5I97DRAFT_1928803 [Phlebopus sp. FC_14]|nr:hypothetical protein F5I97DRAFT_1928803 [Phlebopus sp. FC_14]